MHVCPQCGAGSAVAGFCTADGSALALAADPLLGTEVLRFRLARLIGEGGMGKVYLGVQPDIGSRVAIKILAPHCASSPELLERFFAEGRAVNLIRHENIVSVLDLAQLPDGRPLIVMEYIDGATLTRLVRGGRAPLGGLVRVFGEVLAALAAAHAIGIIHRDVKPDNILITANGHAKVLDFGIAKLAPELSHSQSPRTRTGALLGTPTYMAPEQISGANTIDARADIYAAGVMLFEAVTGRVPFTGATLFDLMRAHVDEAPPSPRSLRADLPADFEAVILTALGKDPAQRFASAAAMARALDRVGRGLPRESFRALTAPASTTTDAATSVPAITQQAPAPPTARRRRPIAVGAAIAAAAALAVGVALVASSRADAPAGMSAAQAPPVAQPSPAAPPVTPVVALAAAPVDATLVLPHASDAAPVVAAIPPPPVDAVHHVAPSDATPVAHVDPLGPSLAQTPAPTAIADEPPAPEPHDDIPTEDAPLQVAASYNPRNFDFRNFLPRALVLARAQIPDAQLVSIELGVVMRDGHVDLTKLDPSASVSERTSFKFRAASKTDGTCIVVVIPGVSRVSVFVDPREMCGASFIPTLRCTLPQLWTRAIAAGAAASSTTAHASFFGDHWEFVVDGFYAPLDDDCAT